MSDLRKKTCCFTGHRDIKWSEKYEIEKRTADKIKELHTKGVKFYGVGGSVGYDTLAAKVLFRLRKDIMPDIKIILVYPFDGFTNKWSEEQKAEYKRLLPKYDKIVKLSDTPSREAYLQRDRHLVDCSGYCICYCKKDTGGTAYTRDYAKKRGLEVFNTYNNLPYA